MSEKNSEKPTRNLTKSKPSTVSDTNTGKTRWLRLRRPEPELPELGKLLDLYWGGSERRISTLTTRIIAVNAVALIMLMIGIVFLGQYHASLIEQKLQNFKTEIELVSASISESAIQNGSLDKERIDQISTRIAKTLGQRIEIFDADGVLISDTKQRGVSENNGMPQKKSLYTIQVLKNMAGLIVKLLPNNKNALPPFSELEGESQIKAGSIKNALQGQFSLSTWSDKENSVILSGSAPLSDEKTVLGAIILTKPSPDIARAVGDAWLNILSAFMITLIITVLLSIYLSGVIARPLRKLARAAEAVRKGKISVQDIPDFRTRNDEIGELSVALKEMTKALSYRMDTIERFAADVAHELKNPLTSLKSAVETVSIVKTSKDKEKLMEIIRHDIERLERLINDISKASRLDAELSRDVFENIDLKETINALIYNYKLPLEREKNRVVRWENQVHYKNLTIKTSSNQAGDIFVLGHAGRLEQVFQNILANAISFSPQKGCISIKVLLENEHVNITFEDEGPGIPENKIKTIFDRFYTQRPQYETYGKHSGLGLSISRQIITAMDGKIFAENIKDSDGVLGARFTVRLKVT